MRVYTAAALGVLALTALLVPTLSAQRAVPRSQAAVPRDTTVPFKVGETLTPDKASEAIKALYATGFFKDVRLETNNDVLIVTLEERPGIASVDFSGMKEFSKDDMKKGLKELGLADGRILDKSLLDKALGMHWAGWSLGASPPWL